MINWKACEWVSVFYRQLNIFNDAYVEFDIVESCCHDCPIPPLPLN